MVYSLPLMLYSVQHTGVIYVDLRVSAFQTSVNAKSTNFMLEFATGKTVPSLNNFCYIPHSNGDSSNS